MKKKVAPVLLALAVFAAACATVPHPDPVPLTPTEKNTVKNAEKGSWIGWLIGTAAGIVSAVDSGDLDDIGDFAVAGEAIGTVAGAAHGARIGHEFDKEEDELLAIEGVDVFRVDGDLLEIFATDDALEEVARNLARYEREIELRATTRERAREVLAILVANGVDKDDVTVRVDSMGPELMLRVN